MLLKLDCVDLICQFDSMLAQSVQQRHAGAFNAIGGIVKATMEKSLMFGDSHLTGKSHANLVKRVQAASELAEALPKAVTACSWDAIRRMVGHDPVSEVDVMRIHADLGKATAIVACSAIGPAIEMLGDRGGSGPQLLKCLKLFTADLQQDW